MTILHLHYQREQDKQRTLKEYHVTKEEKEKEQLMLNTRLIKKLQTIKENIKLGSDD